MSLGKLFTRWVPPVLLALIAWMAWQAANNADFDPVSDTAQTYDQSVQTPLLSVRRVPHSLRAPVNDDLLIPALQDVIADSPPMTCAAVQVNGRQIESSREVAGGLIPASNQKLITSYAALGLLGSEFRFETKVVSNVTPQTGVLDGDLYFVGDGDPFLATEEWTSQFEDAELRSHTSLEGLADAIVANGITSITGGVIGDESLFDSERYGPWDGRLVDQRQSGPLSALNVNEGYADWPEKFLGTFQLRSPSDDPPLNAAAVLARLLQERGVSIDSAPAVGTAPPGAKVLAAITSPPLIDVVTHINSFSSNLGAEMILKKIAAEAGLEGSTEAGASVVANYLESRGIPSADLVIDDGSGLAETDRLTCSALATLLSDAGAGSDLARSLSIVGERGSLVDDFVESSLGGIVRAKTGSLRQVRALSGFVESDDSSLSIAFAYIANEDDILQVEADIFSYQQELLLLLADHPTGPKIDELSPLPALANS